MCQSFLMLLFMVLGIVDSVMGQEQPLGRPGPGPSLLNPDVSFDGLFTVGGFSNPNHLQLGGHDPKVNGITAQNFETTFKSVIDPFWEGIAHMVLLIEEGATKIELEEAYMTSLDFPWGLQLIGGQFFTRFGRLNPSHPHAWNFADQPVINGRVFGGDGLRQTGLQLSWLSPTPFFLEWRGSVQNANGETAPSFINPAASKTAPENVYLTRPLVARPAVTFRDLLYMGGVKSSWDLSESLTAVAGGSLLYGPNNTGLETITRMYGVDLYLKWKPEVTDHGWPFVTWQTEAIWRAYDAAEYTDTGASTHVPAATIQDSGWYSQLVYGFSRGWTAGIRWDWVNGGNSASPDLDQRTRIAPSLTYYPSEFSKIRFQYNFDKAQHRADPIHAVFVQFEFLMGAHGAHQF